MKSWDPYLPAADAPVDLTHVAADDALIDDIAARRPVRIGEALAELLAAWAAEIDREPFPELSAGAAPDDTGRPGGATHPKEQPVTTNRAETTTTDQPAAAPIQRSRVVLGRRVDPPRVHPDYRALLDAPLDNGPALAEWRLVLAIAVATVLLAALIAVTVLS